MNLFIQVENEQALNHPALEENLLQAFGEVPKSWEPFVRISRPILNVYEILDSDNPTYQKINEVWTDVWSLRDMTSEEKVEKQNRVKSEWIITGYHSWIFDEETCSFNSPITYPTDGKQYTWDENNISWIETTIDK
jgi:hypothetical protein